MGNAASCSRPGDCCCPEPRSLGAEAPRTEPVARGGIQETRLTSLLRLPPQPRQPPDSVPASHFQLSPVPLGDQQQRSWQRNRDVVEAEGPTDDGELGG